MKIFRTKHSLKAGAAGQVNHGPHTHTQQRAYTICWVTYSLARSHGCDARTGGQLGILLPQVSACRHWFSAADRAGHRWQITAPAIIGGHVSSISRYIYVLFIKYLYIFYENLTLYPYMMPYPHEIVRAWAAIHHFTEETGPPQVYA